MAFSCLECGNPLSTANEATKHTNQRTLTRIPQSRYIYYYPCWPGKKYPAILAYLSPQGLRFQTHRVVKKREILKIEAEMFHVHAENSVGLRFLNIRFIEQRGQFIAYRL